MRAAHVARGFRVDRSPKGIVSEGDVVWQKDVLRNQIPQFGRPRDALVGSDYMTFTVLSQHVAIAEGLARLPGGTLRVLGRERRTQSSGRISVIGGTGAFAYALGNAYIQTLTPNGSCAITVFHLRLP
jgi:hypothetical protein